MTTPTIRRKRVIPDFAAMNFKTLQEYDNYTMQMEMAAPAAKKVYTICTEENPQVGDIEFILRRLGNPCKVTGLTSQVSTEGVWSGSFLVETDMPSIAVQIILVKGSGSFVDYIVYDHLTPNEETSIPIMLVESTKTLDSECRNSINQRFTKFAVARHRFPTIPLVLYYNTKQVTKTETSLFGRRLLATFGVNVYDVNGVDLLVDSLPFASVEEIVKCKNSIREKKGNVSVKIDVVSPNTYAISAKLSKGENAHISHDPNQGLVTGIASAIYSLDKDATFTITKHGVALDTIKQTTSKFWYANSAYNLRLEGSDVSTIGAAHPIRYWNKDTKSEKAATVNYQNHMEKTGWETIYHNHSSSARSYFTDEEGNEHQVPKDVTIPDVVCLNREKKLIQICEGKILKDCLLGVKQLDNLTKFIAYMNTHYTREDYHIERGLCIYAENLADIKGLLLSYPIFFALDSKGSIMHI